MDTINRDELLKILAGGAGSQSAQNMNVAQQQAPPAPDIPSVLTNQRGPWSKTMATFSAPSRPVQPQQPPNIQSKIDEIKSRVYGADVSRFTDPEHIKSWKRDIDILQTLSALQSNEEKQKEAREAKLEAKRAQARNFNPRKSLTEYIGGNEFQQAGTFTGSDGRTLAVPQAGTVTDSIYRTARQGLTPEEAKAKFNHPEPIDMERLQRVLATNQYGKASGIIQQGIPKYEQAMSVASPEQQKYLSEYINGLRKDAQGYMKNQMEAEKSKAKNELERIKQEGLYDRITATNKTKMDIASQKDLLSREKRLNSKIWLVNRPVVTTTTDSLTGKPVKKTINKDVYVTTLDLTPEEVWEKSEGQTISAIEFYNLQLNSGYMPSFDKNAQPQTNNNQNKSIPPYQILDKKDKELMELYQRAKAENNVEDMRRIIVVLNQRRKDNGPYKRMPDQSSAVGMAIQRMEK